MALLCATAPSLSVPVDARTRRGGEAPIAQRISVRRRSEAEAVDPVLRLRGEPASFLINLHPSTQENSKGNHLVLSLK